MDLNNSIIFSKKKNDILLNLGLWKTVLKNYIEQASTILHLSLSCINAIMVDFRKSNAWPVEILYETKELDVYLDLQSYLCSYILFFRFLEVSPMYSLLHS